MTSPITWFEIPTTDLARASRFYESVLGAPLRHEPAGRPMAVFPYQPGYPSGCLVVDPTQPPGPSGHRLFFAADHAPGGLDGAIARTAASGGQVVLPRTSIGEHGFIALVADTEGNVVGLHAEP